MNGKMLASALWNQQNYHSSCFTAVNTRNFRGNQSLFEEIIMLYLHRLSNNCFLIELDLELKDNRKVFR